LPERVTIVGDGAMGTLCALLLHANGHEVTWWGYQADYMVEMARRRENSRYLPDAAIPENIRVTGEDDCAGAADFLVSAVPCQFLRPVWTRLRRHVPPSVPVCSVTKGIENTTLLRPSEIIADVIGARPIAALSGPCIAPEVVRKLPAAVVVASDDGTFAERVQRAFVTSWFRVYTNRDLIGTELAGATKNVIAMAAGIIDGLGAGDNCKAALLTRGLVEITRLGVALSAQRETFAGLAGLGDLVTTCISPVGRNRSAGEAIGRGRSLAEIQRGTQSVIEGVATTKSVVDLAKRHGVDMPITEGVYGVLFQGIAPPAAIAGLMARQVKAEGEH
jgi:glycerol-3-phosphate dehydrogenase (NAD(P)+)